MDVEIAPLEREEVTISGKRTGFTETAFDELQSTGDLIARYGDVILEVARCQLSPREDCCICLGGNRAAT